MNDINKIIKYALSNVLRSRTPMSLLKDNDCKISEDKK
jgi:hypothetical protein